MAISVGLLALSITPLSLASSLAHGLLSGLVDLFSTGASELVAALLGFVAHSSEPVFSGGWWTGSGEALFVRVLTVAGSLLALAFMCSIVTAVLSGDRSLLNRAALHLPLAVLEMALLVGVTAALVSASDEVATEIAAGATHTLSIFVAAELAGAIGGTGVVGVITGGLIVLASLALWAELLCRSALIYLVVLAGPLVFAASVHPSVRGLRRRYLEAGLSLICSKIVVALALATGAAMLSSLPASKSFAALTGTLLEALAVLLIACFSPFILLRLLLGAEAIVVAEGLSRRPVRAAMASAGVSPGPAGVAQLAHRLGPPGGGDRSGPPPASPPPSDPSPTKPTGGTPHRPTGGAPSEGPAAASTGDPGPARKRNAAFTRTQPTSPMGDRPMGGGSTGSGPKGEPQTTGKPHTARASGTPSPSSAAATRSASPKRVPR